MEIAGKRLIIFDFDGTLVDTMGQYEGIAAMVMEKHYGVAEIAAREFYRNTSGIPFREQLLTEYPNDLVLSQAVKEYEGEKNRIAETCKLFPEVKDVLNLLSGAGYKFAVVSSNSQTFVEKVLYRTQLYPFLWVSGIGIWTDKIMQILNCLLSTETEKRHAMYVGDSQHDMQVASNIGIDFFGVFRDEKSLEDLCQKSPTTGLISLASVN